MVQIDPEVVVNSLLKQGIMIRIDGNILFKTDKTHCIILLNHNPLNDDYLIFASVTSKYEKRINQANLRKLPPETIVMIRPGEYRHLPKYTAIDCNYLHTVTKREFIALYRDGRLMFYKNNSVLNPKHIEDLKKGALTSPLVIEEFKKKIRTK